MATSNQQLMAAEEAPDNVEVLRLILSSEQGREVSYGEASEIADSLISFYEALAEPDWVDPEVVFAANIAISSGANET